MCAVRHHHGIYHHGSLLWPDLRWLLFICLDDARFCWFVVDVCVLICYCLFLIGLICHDCCWFVLFVPDLSLWSLICFHNLCLCLVMFHNRVHDVCWLSLLSSWYVHDVYMICHDVFMIYVDLTLWLLMCVDCYWCLHDWYSRCSWLLIVVDCVLIYLDLSWCVLIWSMFVADCFIFAFMLFFSLIVFDFSLCQRCFRFAFSLVLVCF